jgi:hypothetical protein
MDTWVFGGLAPFLFVVLIVGIIAVVKIRDRESEVGRTLYIEQADHQRRMKELEEELQRIKSGTARGPRGLRVVEGSGDRAIAER